MCGIAGFLTPAGLVGPQAIADAVRMRDRLVHRGPDNGGVWVDAGAGIALAQRRLSVLDLSPAGHQPMRSASGRYILVFNGEIYNQQTLRREAESAGYTHWCGHSDTEALLAGIELWGLDKTLRGALGMFAIALWDREDRVLSLARDRMGEKPLYYGWQGDTFLFGSELKALQAHCAFRSEINAGILPLYLRHGYIPAPWSVWEGIRKLTPGCVLRVESADRDPDPMPYWNFNDVIARGCELSFEGGDSDAIEFLDRHLREAVAGQMVADVPLGAFLSGGVDSSTVVALMQSQSAKAVKTFTIGFTERGYNEAEHAKAVARHLGTDHTEMYVSAAEAREVIPGLPLMFDEPFGDASAIPTHLISRLARNHVTVALSGDGGDELFGGYSRYLKAERAWRAVSRLPVRLRSMASTALRLAPIGHSQRKELTAHLLMCGDEMSFYRTMVSHWKQPPIAEGSPNEHGIPTAALGNPREYVQRLMARDTLTYLPDNILAKVDRAAMRVSLETRIPLLDHRVVEFAWRLPYSMKVREGQGKWLLRQVLYRYVPRRLVDRPKMGFGVPVDQWLRGPLQEWAEELLDERHLRSQGFLNPAPIRKRWKEHLTGRQDWRDSLWLLLMWQSWMATQQTSRPVA